MVAAQTPLTPADTIVRVCLLLVTATALGDGLVQWVQGAPAGGADADNVHRYLERTFATGRFPALATVVRDAAHLDADHTFRIGLDFLLDGIEARISK
ncbi:TetR/AcrR family transcriptional regulator C-terminal domain-containing protein [Streptomyces sp. NPDC005728]|uniref:TetR/AcrR family transcriptional regulator C-terminal domain-containing protein n=1 Tax=Streptomyces sp. NPDC005728 TaxID=3157054 RepID=UPI0033F3CBD3